MKKYSAIIQLTCCIFLTMVGYTIVNGQTYKPGDLYTFQDGSKGIVFYVNPDNPTTGTVAALRDLDGRYALWTGNRPQSLNSSFFPNGYLSISGITSWESHGKHNTQLLAASGTSPVVNAIMDSFTIVGWYIPDAMQLYNLYASAAYLSDAFEFYGGDIQSLWMATHWSSTCLSNPNGNAYMISYNFKLENASGTTVQNVRLVRDFPDDAEIQAYWADSPHLSDTVVSPDFTTDYEAFVVSGFDTLSMAATVTVNLPSTDTLHETVYASSQPYTSVLAPIFNTLDISHPGLYEFKDTLHTIQGCDSIVTLLLTVGENVRYSDTLCPLKEDYYFAPLDTVFAVGTVSGVYEHHGTKLVDGLPVDTIAYYELTILPVYERFDTIRWCLYEPSETRQYEGNAHVSVTVNGASVSGTVVTVISNSEDIVVEEIAANTDFVLRMQTVNGCDSIVFLHVNAQRVERDTVYADVLITQVAGGQHTSACHTFTGIDEPGTYRATDTLTSSNGCDSLVTVVLIVEPLHEETLCDSTLTADLIWQSNFSDYVWNSEPLPADVGTSGYYEFPGQRIVDGVAVDTVSYLQLIVNQSYQVRDTVSFCMEEATYTAPYDDVAGVMIAVAADGTVSVTTEATSDVEVISIPGSTTDFVLRMQTISGCDSVVFLHVDVSRVMRDTVYADVLVTQVAGGQHTAACHTFTGIDAPGTYRATDTLMASNGCDSLVTVVLIVEALHEETLCDSTLTADLIWQSNLADYTWNGEPLPATVGTSSYYEFPGQRIVDGVVVDTVSYLQLIVHQSYQVKDTVSFCMEEATYTAPYDGIDGVTVEVAADGIVSVSAEAASGVEVSPVPGSTTDFLLRMQTISGCDSVVFLHVDARWVERDTVRYIVNQHQVENEHVTVEDYTFEGITVSGTYELRDTLTASNGCDSIVTLLLTVGENVRYSDTLCPLKDDYYFAPLDTVFAVGTVSGVYEHHGTKLVDGLPVDTIAYYDLTILPVYEQFDTIEWCLYEPLETRQYEGNAHVSVTVNGTSVNGTVVTVTSSSEDVVVEEIVANTDFALRMQTTSGCDSVVFLHVDVSRVMRDTVYADVLITQVAGGQHTAACHTFTGIDAPGTYRATDTLTASNGCDSLVTVVLVVEQLHEETICDSTLTADLTWQSNLADYKWNGEPLPATVGTSSYYEFPGQRIVEGVTVDTVSYLQLIVNQSYQVRDTVSFCMEEATYTAPYANVEGVTIALAADGIVSVTAEATSNVEVTSVPGSTTDFALRMQTVNGCDSIVFLHVNAQRVERDTVRYIVNQHQVENNHVTVGDYTFEGITAAGTYELRDTLTASNGCDSIVTLLLTVGENVRYSDTLCPLKEDYYFAPLDTVFAVGTVSGVYEHHGTKLVDGLPVDTIAYYDLTILPVYERFDTISWCLYEPSETRQYEGNAHVSVTVNGASVTVTSNSEDIVVEEIVANTDFALRMQTISGCDSIVFLHVNAQRVERDTVRYIVNQHQVENEHVTVGDYTFESITAAGTYELRDTLTASNGCDSIVTLLLTVGENVRYSDTLCPLKDDYYFAPLDTVFAVGTVSGVYEHHGTKIVDGLPVDTIAYYDLTILPVYEQFDTISWCLYEPSETRQYEGNAHVSVTVSGASVTVTSNSEDVVVEEIASNTDFALRMQTTSGCDSIVFLHVNAQRVERDTVRYIVNQHQIENEHVTVGDYTFESITAAGTYELRDTLTASNGCDSIVTLLLTVGENVRYSDTLCPLKDDYYFAPLDTVFAVGTVSGVYEHHGTKLVDGLPVDTIAYYDLTILPVYERFDTIEWCFYEPAETRQYEGNAHVSVMVNGTSVNGTVVTVTSSSEDVVVEEIVANTDFALRMQTTSGCDSVVFLHVNVRRVMRDTVYADVLVTQVVGSQYTAACHTFTGIDAPGTYRAMDTLTASNGCDSLVTVVLIVEALHEETLCDSTLTADLTWQSNLADYIWNGEPLPATVGTSGYYEFPGQRIVDGVAVDTVSYLQLIVHQSYQVKDTVSFCMAEATYTTPYDDVAGVTIAVAADGTVSVTAEAASGVEVIPMPGSTTDFVLRMQTISGCDSVVFLHVDAQRVERDTVRYIVNQHQVENEHVTVGDYTFESITAAGTYELRDTLTASNGCDSIVTLLLTVGENIRYSDTICPLKEDYYFAPLDTVFALGTVSGVYEHHGTKLVDGLPVDTIAYYDLTILPVYERFDTIRWCLYEPSETRQYEGNEHVSVTVNETTVSGTVVTVTSNSETVVVEEVAANTDFALRMQTEAGCDSVVFLDVDVRRVMRDTVYADVLVTQVVGGQHTVACHTFTGIDALGTYRATDTLTASNGCDSLVTVFLIVEPLHEETICDSTLTADLIWQSNLSDYVWNGEPMPTTVGTSGYYEFSGQRIVDGVTVDTVSYLQLIVNQSYQVKDTVSFCMEEATYTAPYDDMAGVTIAVAADGTVSVTTEATSGVEVTSVPGSKTDFALRMQTTSGCDSIVFLHVNAQRVERDTVRYTIFANQVENEHITVSEHTFEGITTPGVYEIRDTLTAANGCDSVVIHELTVNPCVSDFSIVCPPDVYDTLAYGDCVMTIYPEQLGTPTLLYDGEWPFRISSDMPEDNLFAQGDNIVIWTATDLVCGYSDTCEQHVVIAFPQCPDAVDFEGNVYHGVRIGCDCWTQRNLESRRYSNGDDITGKYSYYSWQHPDTVANVETYGRLYSFEAAVRDSADNGHGHIQGICPNGWFLPTPEHYERLNEYGTPSLRSPELWIVGAGDNSTGFTALPAGYYNGAHNRFEGMLTETYFWSTKTVQESMVKCIYSVDYACDSVTKKYPMSGLGYSVRCVKEK